MADNLIQVPAYAIYQQKGSSKTPKSKNKNLSKVSKHKSKLSKPKQKAALFLQNNFKDEVPKLVKSKLKTSEAKNLPQTESLKPKKKKKKMKKAQENQISEDSTDTYSETNFLEDPMSSGLELFKWLITPMDPAIFLDKHWEKQAFHIKRNNPNYFAQLMTSEKLDKLIRNNMLYYTKNVDVVCYEDGEKKVFNQVGRAIPAALWDYYQNGCSIRILNPQTYDKNLHLTLTTLQEYFGSMVGANIYLTPPGSQGFAPHYDDIEAFVLQLEGRKHWKLYKPEGSADLARYSSPNLNKEELGDPCSEVTLNPGDVLYFKRGMIHEGCTDEDSHSLHITLSVYQRNAYADLFEHLLPAALKKAAENDISFRKGLPLHYLQHLGEVNRDNSSEKRQIIIDHVKKLFSSMIEYLDVDQAADQLGKRLMWDSMPIVVSHSEAERSSREDGDRLLEGKVYNRTEFGLDTEVRLVRYYAIRLVLEDNSGPKIYYCTENAKTYHEEEEQFLELEEHMIPAIKTLQNMYPNYIGIEDLPSDDKVATVELISNLWDCGIIVTKHRLAEYE